MPEDKGQRAVVGGNCWWLEAPRVMISRSILLSCLSIAIMASATARAVLALMISQRSFRCSFGWS